MITFNDLGEFGRFGNQLFQISSTIGYAKKFNYDFGFNENWKYRKYFKNELPIYNIKNDKIYEESSEKEFINVGDDISLYGYFQSEKYFEHCKDLIRYYFEPKYDIEVPTNSCFIHIRRGDYIHLNHILSLDYYIESIDYINNIDKNCNYLLFSDDPKWCEDNMKSFYKLGNKITISDDKDIDDLIKMSKCEYAIIANSSFSWWGSWLGNQKTILCPKIPFFDWVNTSHYYPKEWIKINN